ncbi:MAG: B12-binding domain-containing protein [Bacteroidales bacterium]
MQTDVNIDTTHSKRDPYLAFVLEGNRSAASAYIRDLAAQGRGIREIYDTFIKPALYRVGELWETNRITVAEEHIATSITESIMNEFFYDIVSRERVARKVVLGCVENEFHQVGAKMVADIFEMKGWDTFFPGSNVPTNEMVRYIEKQEPDMVALSVSIYSHIPLLEKMLRLIHHRFDLPVIIGGQAFRYGGKELADKFPHPRYIEDLKELETFIDQYQSHG